MRRTLVALALATAAVAACSSDESDPTSPTPVTTSVAAATPGTAGATAGSSLPDFSLPDVSLPDVSLPDASLPDGTLSEGVQESVSDALANLGLDQDQIDCLLEQVGDTGQLPNMAEITSLLDVCDIELSDITPGG